MLDVIILVVAYYHTTVLQVLFEYKKGTNTSSSMRWI